MVIRIVETLEEELAEENSLRVSEVMVRVGPLSGLIPEALVFCWNEAVEGTKLEGSRLETELTEVIGLCPECRAERLVSNLQSFRCSLCRSPIRRIVAGNELEIMSMNVEPINSAGGLEALAVAS